MEISASLVRIAFLALPGILGSKVYRKLRGRTKKKTWEDFTEILVFATTSYLILGMLYFVLGTLSVDFPGVLAPFWDDSRPVRLTDVLSACGLSFVAALIAAYTHQYGVLNWIGYKIRATKRMGDEDVWTYFLQDRNIHWCFIRDYRTGLIYYGAIRAYSESDETRELILSHVSVYKNADGAYLYHTAQMYLSRDSGDITIQTVKEQKDE